MRREMSVVGIFLACINLVAIRCISQIPSRYDVVIDEIMGDPLPVVGLPNSEFIELKNISANAFDLLRWKITDGSTTATIAVNYELKPDSFVIICPSSAASAFSAIGPVIGVSNFPSINNDRELITLLSPEGNVIHAVEYSIRWFNNAVKSDGGWTLEMIDTHNPCAGAMNWKASADPRGGTPGMKNSVDGINVDQQPPVLLRCFVIDSLTIAAVFDEPVDSSSCVIPSHYRINDMPIGIQSIVPVPPTFDELKLKLGKPLLRGRIYKLEVSGVTDCSGNTINTFNNAAFGISSEADTMDLVINEILFNPKSDGVDFVELYNRSNKVVDASRIFIANRTSMGTISSVRKMSDLPFLIFPGDYPTLSEDAVRLQQQYFIKKPDWLFEIANFPSYPDNEGTVVLLNAVGKIVDEFHYDEQMHFPLINNKEGVSLERIDPAGATNSKENWTSAAASVGYATPTQQNSQVMLKASGNAIITVDPPVFSPDNDGYHDICFIYYNMNQPNEVANITIFDVNGRYVRRLYNNTTLSQSGHLVWDGLGDKQQALPAGIYIISTELFNLQGKTRKYKNTVVLAKKF